MRIPRTQRGYTLIELLLVVVMVGVLATIALVGYRKWINYARTADTKNILLGLTMGLKAYYDDTGGYLDCSSSYTDYYPIATGPNGRKHTFHNPKHSDYPCWRLFAGDTDSPTTMVFTIRAGNAGTGIVPPPTKQTKLNFGSPPTTPWYVLVAEGDLDDNGVHSYFVANSLQPSNIYIEMPHE